jgi:hypothetical protein
LHSNTVEDKRLIVKEKELKLKSHWTVRDKIQSHGSHPPTHPQKKFQKPWLPLPSSIIGRKKEKKIHPKNS